MNRHPSALWAISALSLALSACGGSSQINENPQAGVTRNSCSGTSCLRFEFTVDPVVNLNYRCGSVVDVTTSIGTGQCPSGTVATFYLRAENGQREVVLGTAKIDPARELTGAESTDQPLVRITPLDLSSSAVTGLDAPDANVALNITRLLQGLREQNAQGQPLEPYVDEAPVNRIVISEAMKRGIDKLEKDIPAADFANETTLAKNLKPWLEANQQDSRYPAIALIDLDTARQRLARTLNTLKAGAYWGSPALALFGVDTSKLPGLNSSNLNLGIQSNNTGNGQYTVMQIHVVNDRDNRAMGQGMHWSGTAANLQDASSLYTSQPYSRLRLKSDQARFNTLNNRIENYQWALLSRTDGSPQAEISFDTGRLLRDVVVAGSEATYRSYTNLSNLQQVPAGELGTWSQKILINGQPAQNASVTGTDTLYKTSNADTFLDRAVWRVASTVASGQRYIFPLSLKLTFKYGSNCSPTNPSACTSTLSADPIGITLLPNGNIVSDRNHDCNGSLTASLRDGSQTQEYRVGYVRAAYLSPDKSSAYVAPTLLVGSPDIYGEAYDGLQLSTQSPAPRAKLDVAALISSSTGTGVVTLSDASTTTDTQSGTKPAEWINIYNVLLSLRTAGAPLSTEEQTRRARAQGIVMAELADCYTTMTK